MRMTVRCVWNWTLVLLVASAGTACTSALRQHLPAGSPVDTGPGRMSSVARWRRGSLPPKGDD